MAEGKQLQNAPTMEPERGCFVRQCEMEKIDFIVSVIIQMSYPSIQFAHILYFIIYVML